MAFDLGPFIRIIAYDTKRITLALVVFVDEEDPGGTEARVVEDAQKDGEAVEQQHGVD